MKRKKTGKRGINPRKIEKYLEEAAKRGELDPKHRRDFNQLLDDVVLPPSTKKK